MIGRIKAIYDPLVLQFKTLKMAKSILLSQMNGTMIGKSTQQSNNYVPIYVRVWLSKSNDQLLYRL